MLSVLKASIPLKNARFRRILNLGPLLPALICLAASLALRFWMYKSLPGSPVWAFQGALRDAMPISALAILLYRFKPQGLRKVSLALAISFWTVAILFVSVSDGIYFAQSGRRLDSALIENMSLTSLAPAETPGVITGLSFGLMLMVVVAWALVYVLRRPNLVRRGESVYRSRMLLCVLLVLGAALPWPRAFSPAHTDASRQRANEMLATGQAENAADVALALWETGPDWDKPVSTPLADGDRAWAGSHGLLPVRSALDAPFGAPRWRRVVVVAVESLAGAFLDQDNPRRPKGMTPFLDSLQDRYPHLANCYSAGTDTEQGQYALMCGRTDFEWNGHPYPGASLFSLARQAGYETCMLYGDTVHFRDHDTAYPATLHIDQQFCKESFEGRRPASDFCSWGGGLCDRAVFEEALGYLRDHRRKPSLLLVDTLDTHPPYYWQKKEADFPAAVRATDGGLPRALNQLDDNIAFFIRAMQSEGLLDSQTLVVVTADHFPAFGKEALALSGADGYGTNRIPMLFVTRAAGAFAGLDRRRLSSQLDLAPTLARLMNLGSAQEFMGRDLLARGPGRALGRDRDLLRLRVEGEPEKDVLLDPLGRPRTPESPLSRWYRWKIGQL